MVSKNLSSQDIVFLDKISDFKHYGSSYVFSQSQRMTFFGSWYNHAEAKNNGVKNIEEKIENERKIATKIFHKNLLKLVDSFKANSNDWFLYQYTGNGNLDQFSKNHKTELAFEADYIVMQLLEGLTELHKHKVCHCSIEPSNIFVFDENENELPTIKLGNYQNAKYESHFILEIADTISSLCYKAPEIIENPKKYSTQSDLWSVGILYFWLLHKKTPWKNLDDKNKLVTEIQNFDINKYKLNYQVRQESKELLQVLLHNNPDERKNFDFIKKMKIFDLHTSGLKKYSSFSNLLLIRQEDLTDFKKIFENVSYWLGYASLLSTGEDYLLKKYYLFEECLIHQTDFPGKKDLSYNINFDHPNLAKVKYWFYQNSTFNLLYKFPKHGTLTDYIKKKKIIPENEAIIILDQILEGANYLHNYDPHLVHRDINPTNILVYGNKQDETKFVCKLFNFASTVQTKSAGSKNIGVLFYQSPEALKETNASTPSRKTDYWSLGIIYHEMLLGKTPWSTTCKIEQIEKEILSFNSNKLYENESISELSKALLVGMLKKDESIRMDYIDIKNKINKIMLLHIPKQVEPVKEIISDVDGFQNELKKQQSTRNRRSNLILDFFII